MAQQEPPKDKYERQAVDAIKKSGHTQTTEHQEKFFDPTVGGTVDFDTK